MTSISTVTPANAGEPLAAWLQAAFEKAFGEAAQDTRLRVLPSTDPSFGDFQCNDAMGLAKTLRLPPRTIATRIVEALDTADAPATANIAGPGFINLAVTPGWLAGQLAALADDARFGLPDIGGGRTIIIDYSSPNVAKPMHIGHIRSTIIGNALDRLYQALGFKVIADNHLGDWGTQFGILINGFRAYADPGRLRDAPIEELERVYRESYARTEKDPEWLDACRAELVRLQQGDPDNLALWRQFIDLSLREFNRIYERLDVTFDLYRGESYYNDQLAATVALLEERGLARESEGALVVPLDDEGMPVCIVRKSDGGYNYATTDIATVLSREAEFQPDRIIYVTDERQQLHFRQFFAVCRKLGCTTRLEHVWFGLMRLPEGTFSTRQGNVIRLDALLDEAESRALAIIRESSPGMPEEQQQALARDIGIGAVKYADLSHDPQNMIVFTWDRALALDGNSGPYLQYAYARIRSLLDKYAEACPGCDPAKAPLLLQEPVERQLALQIMQYPATVVRAAENCKPSLLADHLYALSQLYSSFYQRFPILKADPAIRDSRARLCTLVARVLREGLGLLGIATPERI
ncbi:MAG: arginine--tRNA ligase [Lentisphaerae bacterium]|jgi:arginyl-tRNA synthetase|nr:arginine--tRNA ligase [Lentisphaerota bacterium]